MLTPPPSCLPAQGRLYDIFEMFRRLDFSMVLSQITLTILVSAASLIHVLKNNNHTVCPYLSR